MMGRLDSVNITLKTATSPADADINPFTNTELFVDGETYGDGPQNCE
jgi:hypothetical protein